MLGLFLFHINIFISKNIFNYFIWGVIIPKVPSCISFNGEHYSGPYAHLGILHSHFDSKGTTEKKWGGGGAALPYINRKKTRRGHKHLFV